MADMKIIEVRAAAPETPGVPNDWRKKFGQLVVAVRTDAGITGYGVGGGGPAGVYIVEALLSEVLLGRDPLDTEAHWQRMYRAVLPFGRTGLALWALSGVDLALWDLRGKAEKQPVYQLLGGKLHDRVPAYATSLGVDPGPVIESGFRIVKLHLPSVDDAGGRNAVAELVARAREKIGPHVRLMADAFMQWNVADTLALAPAFKTCGVEWIEEPLPSFDLEGYRRLASECAIPIAGGEHEQTAQSFEMLARERLHRVLQPDATWCGGLTELIRIYRAAEKYGVRVCQHRGAEPWGLHALVALEPRDPLAEEGRRWMQWLPGAPKIVDGFVAPPDGPGFGVELGGVFS